MSDIVPNEQELKAAQGIDLCFYADRYLSNPTRAIKDVAEIIAKHTRYEGKTADQIATMWVRELARAEAAEAKYHAGVDAWLATRHELANALQRVKELEAEKRRLESRDCNATIELVFNDGSNPFARETLKVIDVGVADNIYCVESSLVPKLQQRIAELEAAVAVLVENERKLRRQLNQ